MRTREPAEIHAPQDDLLLIAAGERADLLAQAAHPDCEPFGDRAGALGLTAAIDQPVSGARHERRVPEVVLDRRTEHEAKRLAVLGNEAHASGDGRRDAPLWQWLAKDYDRAGVVGIGACDRSDHLGATRADEAGNAQDLSGAHLEGDVGEGALPGEALDAEQGLLGRGGATRELLVDAPAHHQTDEFRLRGRSGNLGDELAVADDGHAVTDRGNLFEVMGDEHHSDTLRTELTDYAEKVLDLVFGERGRSVRRG